MSYTRKFTGFTLIELIVVMGIIAILAGIVILAVNPGRQFAQARNTQRRSDSQALLDAIHQNAADNNGTISAAIPTGVAACGSDYADLTALAAAIPAVNRTDAANATLVTALTPTYITAMPSDPSSGGSGAYIVCKDANSRISVYATTEETPFATNNLIRYTR